MTEHHVTFLRILGASWSLRSSSLWSEENPANGQCGVTALVAQDRFGGEILKTAMPDGAMHFYNRIEGRRVDFTVSQFDRPPSYDDIASSRDEAFSDTNQDRYRALSERVRSMSARG